MNNLERYTNLKTEEGLTKTTLEEIRKNKKLTTDELSKEFLEIGNLFADECLSSPLLDTIQKILERAYEQLEKSGLEKHSNSLEIDKLLKVLNE